MQTPGFKDFTQREVKTVFLNTIEFGEKRILCYDGATYDGADGLGIPVVIERCQQESRHQFQTDHAQGLFRTSMVLHCARDDLGDPPPEKGQHIHISDEEGGGFFRSYYVASTACEMGMLRIELEAIDE